MFRHCDCCVPLNRRTVEIRCAHATGLAKLLPGTAEQRDALMKETIPLKRVGRKWDIAMAVLFLSSPAAAYITGASAAALASSPTVRL